MKICMLTDDPFSLGGGPEHIQRISEILRDKYHCTVDIVTPKTMDSEYTFFDFGQRVKYVFWTIWFLLTSDYDIYHSHSFSTSLVLPASKLNGKKIGFTVHGMGVKISGGGILNMSAFPRLLINLILNYWPFDFRLSASSIPRFITVGNGVDVSEFSKVRHNTHEIFTVLCISRRDPVKGIDILEQAVKAISNCRLNLVSGRKWTLEDFSSADCYVLPSLSEGLPIVLLEAMAAKLPIVTTDVGDCRSLIERSKSGCVVKSGDLASLISGIQEMQSNSHREDFGENGFKYVKQHYTWDKVARMTFGAYEASLKTASN